MIIAATPYGPGGSINTPLYDYTGTKPTYKEDGNGNWEIVLTADCSIRFHRLLQRVDICLVAGGKPGSAGKGNMGDAYGGDGGDGGEVKNLYGRTLEIGKNYACKIGKSGENTSAFGYTAETGKGSTHGTGAHQNSTSLAHDNASPGGDGKLAFFDDPNENDDCLIWPGYKFGPGGGAGAARIPALGYWSSASDGGMGWIDPTTGNPNTGGGNGGQSAGSKGDPNSGGGGAGGASDHLNTATEKNYSGGPGGTGVVIIRNHRA